MERYCAKKQKGHAIHFLERLDRAEGAAAELALQLYQDPELLRDVLRSIGIAKKGDRCALSLDAEDKGPYLVISTQNGRFITCLGKGMAIGRLHLIPFGQLCAHIEKGESLRRRMALAREFAGDGGHLNKLYSRIRTRGEELSREELLAISALQPALQARFFIWTIDAVIASSNLGLYLFNRKRIGAREEPYLKEYWNFHFAAGHLAVLSGMNSVNELRLLYRETDLNPIRAFCSLLRAGRVFNTIRILWLIGRIGPTCFSHCRQLLLHPEIPEDWIIGIFGILVIGLRHKKCKKQAEKALGEMVKAIKDFPKNVLRLMGRIFDNPETWIFYLFSTINCPEQTTHLREKCVKEYAFYAYTHCPLNTVYSWESENDIPLTLAYTLSAHYPGNFYKEPPLLLHILYLVPWLAKCEAEDLYLPQVIHDALHEPWNASKARELLYDENDRIGKTVPVTVDKSPGRNEPCPCGSEKKYKKCCIGKDNLSEQPL